MMFFLAEYCVMFLLATIILTVTAVSMEDSPLGGVIGILALLCFMGAVAGSCKSDDIDYLAYRYDKIVAERPRIAEKCPDTNTAECLVLWRDYRTDSIGIYFRYRDAFQRFE